jgi:hypothetical protein
MGLGRDAAIVQRAFEQLPIMRCAIARVWASAQTCRSHAVPPDGRYVFVRQG